MLYEIILQARYYNRPIINRWNYVSTTTPAAVTGSFGLAAAFGGVYDATAIPPGYPADTVLGRLMNVLSNQLTAVQLTALAVYDPTDFYQLPFLNAYVGGQSAGEGMSPTTAYGFRTNQVRRDIARGKKRFAGVIETYSGGGGVITSGITGALTTLAARMTETIEYNDEGTTLTYTPVIVSKQRYNPETQLPSATGTAYRYYPTLAEQEDHWAQGITWEYYPETRTQRSRQYD